MQSNPIVTHFTQIGKNGSKPRPGGTINSQGLIDPKEGNNDWPKLP